MKRAAAEAAAALVVDGMTVGLGSGSTAREFVRALGRRRKTGLDITAVASSVATAEVAREYDITLIELREPLDIAVDGADAVDRDSLDAIKGLGGALTRERIVAEAARRFVLIVDETKIFSDLSDAMTGTPIPVATVPFGWQTTRDRLSRYGNATLRLGDDGKPYATDDGNFILDLRNAGGTPPEQLAGGIKALTGVVDHGLFRDLASHVLIGTANGVQTLQRNSG